MHFQNIWSVKFLKLISKMSGTTFWYETAETWYCKIIIELNYRGGGVKIVPKEKYQQFIAAICRHPSLFIMFYQIELINPICIDLHRHSLINPTSVGLLSYQVLREGGRFPPPYKNLFMDQLRQKSTIFVDF